MRLHRSWLAILLVPLLAPVAASADDDFARRGGVGIDVYVTRNIVIDVEASYVHPRDRVEDFDYVSTQVGLQYRF